MQKIQSDRKSLQTLVVWIFDEKGFDMLRVDGRKQPHILEKVKYGLERPRPITAGGSDCMQSKYWSFYQQQTTNILTKLKELSDI